MSTENNSISRSVRRKKEDPKKKLRKQIIQISLGIIVFFVISLIAMKAQTISPNGAFIVFIGAMFGYVLQRSRFCFTASLRDPFLTGGTQLTKAVIISLALISFLFMAITMSKIGMDFSVLNLKLIAGNIRPVGIHTVIGAFIFGVGAVIAGGCASGTVMRMGEGFIQQWLTFVFFVAGAVIGIPLSKMIVSSSANPVFLPEALGGWVPAIIVHFGLLFALYIIADMWGKKNSK
jgi:uncharacterized protein